jgi:hypothetical protein
MAELYLEKWYKYWGQIRGMALFSLRQKNIHERRKSKSWFEKKSVGYKKGKSALF